MSHQEALVTIPGEVPLHGVVHGCLEHTHPAWGLVFCDPFAEEKKCAHRVMVEAARAFCTSDIGCLRFDYRGTGDSPGDFEQATPEAWVQDIIAAARYAKEQLGLQTLGLLGLRLGASLALQAAMGYDAINYLVLWEPIINGQQYLGQNLRRSMIKAMLTDTEGFDAGQVRQSHQEAVCDFDGYAISKEMRRQIERLDLLEQEPVFSGPTLVVNLTAREQPAEPYRQLGELLDARVLAVRQEPFWNRIGLIKPDPVVRATEIWLAEQQAAWLADRT